MIEVWIFSSNSVQRSQKCQTILLSGFSTYCLKLKGTAMIHTHKSYSQTVNIHQLYKHLVKYPKLKNFSMSLRWSNICIFFLGCVCFLLSLSNLLFCELFDSCLRGRHPDFPAELFCWQLGNRASRKTIKEVESRRRQTYLYFVVLKIYLYYWEGGRKARKDKMKDCWSGTDVILMVIWHLSPLTHTGTTQTQQ